MARCPFQLSIGNASTERFLSIPLDHRQEDQARVILRVLPQNYRGSTEILIGRDILRWFTFGLDADKAWIRLNDCLVGDCSDTPTTLNCLRLQPQHIDSVEKCLTLKTLSDDSKAITPRTDTQLLENDAEMNIDYYTAMDGYYGEPREDEIDVTPDRFAPPSDVVSMPISKECRQQCDSLLRDMVTEGWYAIDGCTGRMRLRLLDSHECHDTAYQSHSFELDIPAAKTGCSTERPRDYSSATFLKLTEAQQSEYKDLIRQYITLGWWHSIQELSGDGDEAVAFAVVSHL